MESRATQILSFLLVTGVMTFAATVGLSAVNEYYFYALMGGRIGLALAGLLLLLLVVSERDKPLAEGTTSLLFLTVALSESFLAYLQANVFGLSYLILSTALVLSSAVSFVSLRASLVSMLPSQLTILGAPLLSLPLHNWSDRTVVTQNLILPVATLLASSSIWFFNSIFVHRKTTGTKLRSMQRQQELLQAQMLLLRKQPRTLKLPKLHETVRDRVIDQHAGIKQNAISDQVKLDDVTDILREAISLAQSKFADRKAMRVTLDLPAPMSLPVAVAAELKDLRDILSAAVTKSVGSLNGEAGVVRVALRVGYKAVSVTIEDNGWGLREKFSDSAAPARHPEKHLAELSLREIQAMVSFWGGRLEVLSRLGVGSRMSMELVRVDAFATDSHEERKAVDELQTNAASRTST